MSKASAWQYAKKRYMIWYEGNYDYIHCLNDACGSPNQKPHSVHHIIARSKASHNKNLHHMDNLIMLCDNCHNVFHHCHTKDEHRAAMKWKHGWVQARGLNRLFGKIK